MNFLARHKPPQKNNCHRDLSVCSPPVSFQCQPQLSTKPSPSSSSCARSWTSTTLTSSPGLSPTLTGSSSPKRSKVCGQAEAACVSLYGLLCCRLGSCCFHVLANREKHEGDISRTPGGESFQLNNITVTCNQRSPRSIDGLVPERRSSSSSSISKR